MKNKNSNTSTGSPSSSPKNWYNYLTEWSLIWWPIILLVLILITAGITKYLFSYPIIYSMMIDLTKAIGLLMIVMYVIYTRILSLETKRMAEASMGLYISEKGMVLAEPVETSCEYNSLVDDAKKATLNIHIDDKKLTKPECDKLFQERNIPSISLKIKNISGRRIEANKIEYKVRHTGSDKFHDIVCDISKIGTIIPWADMEVPLILAPEGEIEILVNSFFYLDGGIVQRISVGKSIILERIRKPENTANG